MSNESRHVERLTRALELARAQRARLQGVEAPRPIAPVAEPEPASAAGQADFTAGFEALRTREVAVDEAALRRSHILAPNAVGTLSHSFKMLRTQVLQRMRQQEWRTLAVLSAAPEDGKTFTAINLAIAIAGDVGSSALLVDLDLRNPSVHRRFGFQPAVGVESCLRGEHPLAEALVRPAGYERLTLLPAAGPVAHSSELLVSDGAARVVREIRSRYANRVILFDLPPVLGADDALAFAPQVDAALVVVSEGGTRSEDLLRCMELLRNTAIIGTVLNQSSGDASAGYAY